MRTMPIHMFPVKTKNDRTLTLTLNIYNDQHVSQLHVLYQETNKKEQPRQTFSRVTLQMYLL